MSNRRSWSFHEGDRYEYFVTYILSAIASVIPVPRQEDYGIDHIGFITREDSNILYVENPLGIQIKAEGKENTLIYGGEEKGSWKHHEINWLFGQEYPLLIGVVNRDKWTLNIYSTAPIWRVKPEAGTPFEVILKFNTPPGKIDRATRPDKKRIVNLAIDGIAGGSWTVELGPPILSLNENSLRKRESRYEIYSILKYWLEFDHRNIRHSALNIPYAEEIPEWETNKKPTRDFIGWWFFNTKPGFNQKQILATINPMIVDLAFNMHAQNDKDLALLKGVLQLIDKNGLLQGAIKDKFSNLLGLS